MPFAPSPELRAVGQVVHDFLTEVYPEDTVRRYMETDAGHDPAAWTALGEQLGLHGLLVPEDFGGSGSGFAELVTVLEKMGAALMPGPYLASSVVAVLTVTTVADREHRTRMLPGLADGTTIGTLAVAEQPGGWDLTATTTTASPASKSWTVTGRKDYVLDGHCADVLLVSARTGEGVAIFEVDARDPTVQVVPHPALDQTRRLAAVDLRQTPARLIGPVAGAEPALRRTLDLAAIALSAEALGGAQRCLDDAVSYAKIRVQFGQVIGGFQAVKHRCADTLLKVEAARSAVRYAAWAADTDSTALSSVASTCRIACSEAYSYAAAQNIQVHGGIGFTWEHRAHLHFKRAHSTALLLDDCSHHREQLAHHLLDRARRRPADDAESEPFADLREFRHELREWIRDNADPELSAIADWNALPSGDGGQRAEQLLELSEDPRYRKWSDTVLDAKLICPHWPIEFGGQGWDARRMAVYVEECHRAGVPRVHRGMGESVVGPSLIAHGTPDQQQRFLPRIIAGQDWYCQGFSEPDHGSDLAAIRTRGVIDGDHLVVTGTKIWTTYAHRANMIFLLCRTDPAAPKHRGLSYVLSEFQPGEHIEVRPVRQMSGAQDFSEEFIDGLRVPLANVIGGLGNGWAVAMTTLGGERSGRATGQQLARTTELHDLVAVAVQNGRTNDPIVRQQLGWAHVETELLRYCRLRMLGDDPGATAEIWKLQWSEYHQRLSEIAMEIIGPASMIRPTGPGYPTDRWQDTYLAARAATIYAGTSEIQRNILAERVLGLPR